MSKKSLMGGAGDHAYFVATSVPPSVRTSLETVFFPGFERLLSLFTSMWPSLCLTSCVLKDGSENDKHLQRSILSQTCRSHTSNSVDTMS